ncbi:phage protein Gp37, partial [Salmonella enterica]|uniref:phage protein Gp37 n=1 Tax=Salmonella enterica TaxID=28901 RepID=UPI0011160B5F
EPGTYRLTYAVRRLLAGQDLGLAISPLRPGAERTLFSRQLADNAISVLACEFDADWIAHTLENGRWPEEEQDDTKADHLFTLHNGRLDEPVP